MYSATMRKIFSCVSTGLEERTDRMKAINLDDVLINFNHQIRLNPDQLKAWFVERPSSPRSALGRWLRAQKKQTTAQKIIFIGHRGSGKSTELAKLAEELQDEFLIVQLDVLESTGRTDLALEDLMLVLFTRVFRKGSDEGWIQPPLTAQLSDRWQQLYNWFTRVVAGLTLGASSAEKTFGASLKLGIVELEAEVRQSAEAREAIHRELSFRMTELLGHLNWVIEQAENTGQKPLLIIIEGLDKVDLEAARRIFLDRFATLNAPQAYIIFTCPSALRYSEDFEQIRQQFSRVEILPNIPPKQRSGRLDKEDWKHCAR